MPHRGGRLDERSGNHSIPAPLDIGLTDASRRTPDMPLYTLRNKTTHATRGAPSFHNGFAADSDAVIDFYDSRFNLHLASRDKHDLVAFLSMPFDAAHRRARSISTRTTSAGNEDDRTAK